MVNKDQSACIECGNVNAEQVFTIIENKVVNEFGRFTDQRKISPNQWNEHFASAISLPQPRKTIVEPLKSELNLPNKINQFMIFMKRDILSKLGNRQYLLITFLEAPLLALFLSYLIRYYIADDEGVYYFSDNENIPVYFFMSIIVALFVGLTVSAEEILRDRKILKRESFLNLSKASYLFAKIGILFGISAIQALTFVLIGNSILEVKDMYWSMWLILFTCSCVANITGLNISSAFDSAVTIYILIPLLIIPQLIISGVVIKFDKFNPSVSAIDKVPLFGEFIASRWGFEALLVKQYKDNRFGSNFYEINKILKQTKYKKLYYFPAIETKLSDVQNNFLSNDPAIRKRVEKDLRLLYKELEKETRLPGKDKFPDLEKLNYNDFSPDVNANTRAFVNKLKNFYENKNRTYSGRMDSLIRQMTNTPQNEALYNSYMKKYSNEAISAEVNHDTSPVKIVENNNQLIQKIYPIYSEPQPLHSFDFRAIFYSPTKYFMGYLIDTFWFNIVAIWVMSIILTILLYFDLLRKLVKSFGKVYYVKVLP